MAAGQARAADLQAPAATAAAPPVAGSVVTELHLLLQATVCRLHDAIYMVPQIAASSAREGVPPPAAEGYANDLIAASNRFQALVRSLPPELHRRRPSSEEAAELEALAREDCQALQELRSLSERAEELRREASSQLRAACTELCGGAVTFRDAEELPAPEQHPQEEAQARGGAPPAPERQAAAAPGARLQDLKKDRSRRFAEELEFLQCLANPDYVQWLATQGYFERPEFLEFLRYLRYWREPPHVLYVVYPQALRMLEMLQQPEFRSRLHRQDSRELLTTQLMWTWASAPERPLLATASARAHAEAVDAARPAEPTAEAEAEARRSAAAASEPGGSLVGGRAAEALEQWDVRNDWARLTGVVAGAAWHEKMEKLDGKVFTVQHDAQNIAKLSFIKANAQGGRVLSRGEHAQEAQRFVDKYARLWEDPLAGCDLAHVLAAADLPAPPKRISVASAARALAGSATRAAEAAAAQGAAAAQETAGADSSRQPKRARVIR